MPPIPDRGPKIVSVGGERLGVNLWDVTDPKLLHPEVVEGVVGGKLERERNKVIRLGYEPPYHDTLLEFNCDLLTAAIACDVLRGLNRQNGDPPTRVYIKRAAWERVPAGETLTVMIAGRPALNPKLFRVVTKIKAAPPPGD